MSDIYYHYHLSHGYGFLVFLIIIYPMDMDSHTPKLIYSRNQLLALKTKCHAGVIPHSPEEVRKPYHGCRAGAKLKAKQLRKKWRYKPTIHSVIKGNVNSLTNKIKFKFKFKIYLSHTRLYREYITSSEM